MRFRKGKGQSTLEYLIVLAVIIAIIVVIATGTFREQISTVLRRVSRKPASMVYNFYK
ncbi:MAG: hypothetical protein AB1629_01835 [Candidatus Omnitrophota bacterium]